MVLVTKEGTRITVTRKNRDWVKAVMLYQLSKQYDANKRSG